MNYFVDDWNGVWKDIPVERGLASEADVYLTWQDITSPYRSFVERIHAIGKKVYVLQHGRAATTDYLPPMNVTPVADLHLVWSDADVRRMESIGWKNYIKVGCPLFESLKPREEHKGINVVFCPAHFSIENNFNLLIAKELRKQFNVTSKILGVHLEEDYDNPVISRQNDKDHFMKVADVLKTADIVVGVEDGTFEMLAMSLDIPVVCVNPEFEPFDFGGKKVESFPHSKGVHVTTLEDLNNTVNYVLTHPDEKKKERKEVVMEEGGFGLPAISNILEAIK